MESRLKLCKTAQRKLSTTLDNIKWHPVFRWRHSFPSFPAVLLGHQSRKQTTHVWSCFTTSLKPRYNEGPRDWQNLFAIPRFRYIEVLLHIFYYYWGMKKSFVVSTTSLYRGSTVVVLVVPHSTVIWRQGKLMRWRDNRSCWFFGNKI